MGSVGLVQDQAPEALPARGSRGAAAVLQTDPLHPGSGVSLSPSPLPGAKPELVTQMRAGCCLIASRAPPSIATQTSGTPPEIQPGSPRLGERCAGYTDIKSTGFPLIIFLNICRC